MKETLLNFLIEIAKNRGMVRTEDSQELCLVCNSPLDIKIESDKVLLVCQFKEHCLLSLPIKDRIKENTNRMETHLTEFKTVEGHRLNQWEYERIKRLLEQGLSLRATQKALRIDGIFVSLGTLSKIKKLLKTD